MVRLRSIRQPRGRVQTNRETGIVPELVQTLQDYEEEESLRFDRMEREWEDQLKDPDDVFFAAQNRKREIKEQIKELQKGLKRQNFKPRSKKKHS